MLHVDKHIGTCQQVHSLLLHGSQVLGELRDHPVAAELSQQCVSVSPGSGLIQFDSVLISFDNGPPPVPSVLTSALTLLLLLPLMVP
jgi:hypothetical protein